MKPNEIHAIRQLDPKQTDGTVMSVLLRDDLQRCSYVGTLEFLCRALMLDKQTLQSENANLTRVLKENNLYKSELIFEEKG